MFIKAEERSESRIFFPVLTNKRLQTSCYWQNLSLLINRLVFKIVTAAQQAHLLTLVIAQASRAKYAATERVNAIATAAVALTKQLAVRVTLDSMFI